MTSRRSVANLRVRGLTELDHAPTVQGVVQPAFRYFCAEMSQDLNRPIELSVSINTISDTIQSLYTSVGFYELRFPLITLSPKTFVMVNPDDNSYQLFASFFEGHRVQISTQIGGVVHDGQMTNAKLFIISPIE